MLKSLILPPGLFLVILLAGLAVRLKRDSRHAGNALTVTAILCIYLTSIPITASTLMAQLQTYRALSPGELKAAPAQAIVILGGGRQLNAPEYQGDTVNFGSLVRIRYGAYIHKLTGLPILVSGGNGAASLGSGTPEAVVMAESLERDFGTRVQWKEILSRTTFENAFNAVPMLKDNGIGHILLVTHAWHMPRAKEAFEALGIQVTAAPTYFENAGSSPWNFRAWLPNANALHLSSNALHELIGIWWYRQQYQRMHP